DVADGSGEPQPSAIPCQLSANGALLLHLVFPIHRDLLGGGVIEGFEVVVADSRGVTQSTKFSSVREVVGNELPLAPDPRGVPGYQAFGPPAKEAIRVVSGSVGTVVPNLPTKMSGCAEGYNVVRW